MIGKHFNESKEYGTLMVRVGLGSVFVVHGAQKLFGAFGGDGIDGTARMLRHLDFPIATAFAVLLGIAELGGGCLVIAGIVTRYAALTLAIVMTVAIAMVHWRHGFTGSNGWAFPFALGMMALSLVVSGGGVGSVDKMVKIDDKV